MNNTTNPSALPRGFFLSIVLGNYGGVREVSGGNLDALRARALFCLFVPALGGKKGNEVAFGAGLSAKMIRIPVGP